MTRRLTTQDVIDIEDIITVLIIISIILRSLTRLRQDSSRIARTLVLEGRVADSIRGREMRRQGLQWLYSLVSLLFQLNQILVVEVFTLINPPSGFARRRAGCT